VAASREWNRSTVRGNVHQAGEGMTGEAFLRVFAIRNDLGAGSYKSRDGFTLEDHDGSTRRVEAAPAANAQLRNMGIRSA
jgi:hypothetical protein